MGSNYDNVFYKNALVNEAKVLAGVHKLKINFQSVHFQPHLIVLMKHLKNNSNSSVWQGDANKALASAPEDSSSTNDWLIIVTLYQIM